MRLAAWTVAIALALESQAFAQFGGPPGVAPGARPVPQQAVKQRPAKKAPAKAAVKEEAPPTPAPPATAAQKAAYAALPVAERLAIQSDLVWAGDLVGGLDPEFGDRAVAAVKSFQKRNKFEENGILTP